MQNLYLHKIADGFWCGMQLCKAQEVKIRLTGDTWQQETCQRFLHQVLKPDVPNAAECSTAPSGAARAVPGNAPGELGQGPTALCEYWQLLPGVRLRMLRDLCDAALDTYIFRYDVQPLLL